MAGKTPMRESTFGADLIEGIELVLSHARGGLELEQVWPKPVDIKAIRKQVTMT